MTGNSLTWPSGGFRIEPVWLMAAFGILLLSSISVFAGIQISDDADGKLLTVEDSPDMQVIAVSRNVVIRKHAKAVLVWGGDVTIEGRVDEDVAAIGGNVIQKEGAFIGGDVIVFGGQYRAEGNAPLRADGKQTIMFGAFEEELRSTAQDPTQILSPSLTSGFFIQRLLAVLFWFLVTLGAATLTPGAVGRGIAGLKLSALKIAAIGAAGFILTCIAVIAGLSFLPESVSAIVGLMAFVLIMLTYVFGRVVVHVLIGRYILEKLVNTTKPSESISIIVGVLACITLLSIPYIWPLALFAFFSLGVGLVMTSRNTHSWKAG